MKRKVAVGGLSLLICLTALFATLYGIAQAQLIELRHAIDVEIHNRASQQAFADVHNGDRRQYELSNQTWNTREDQDGFTVWNYERHAGRAPFSEQFAEAYVKKYNEVAVKTVAKLDR